MANDHRVPPKPPWFESTEEGVCKWCNTEVGLTAKGRPSKSKWHPACVAEYRMLFWPTVTRKAVWRRDKGRCASCQQLAGKHQDRKWHMDHIKPLIEAQGDLNYWRLSNLQTLCSDCHKAKTSQEATDRATKRRLLKEEGKDEV